MAITHARVPTSNGAKYLTQLCKHWSHRLEVEFTETHGVVRFASAVAILDAAPDALLVKLEADEAATLERMKGVVASHLDRFAFREAPLQFEWSDHKSPVV